MPTIIQPQPSSEVATLGMNRVSGQVVLKESGVGIPDLLVVFYDVDPQTQPEEFIAGADSPIAGAESPIAAAGFAVAPDDHGGADRLGAVLTSKGDNSSNAGSFELTYDDSEFQVRNAQERRPDLLVQVLAPEGPGQTLESRVLYVSTRVRQNAGKTEQYIIRIPGAALEEAGIPVPSETPEDFEPSTNLIGRLKAMAARQNDFVAGAVDAAKDVVGAHRTRVSTFNQNFKTTLQSALSNVAATPIAPERIVAPGESVFTKSSALITSTVTGTINDPTKRAPVRGFISLTDDQVNQLRAQAGPDGIVPADAVSSLTGTRGAPPTTYVQALERLPLCQPTTPNVDCTDSVLNPGSPSTTNPPPPPGSEDTSITSEDVPRFLGRVMEPLTAPEEQLVIGLMPVATRDSVQASVQSFEFNPSPADVPAFHDFNNLQIAFDYVWQEAIDQGVLDLAQNAYETIVELGGDPDYPDYKNIHPLQALSLEGKLVLNAHATPTVVVRDHRGEAPGTRIASPGAGEGGVTVTVTGLSSDGNCPYASASNVRDHRAGVVNPMTIDDPVERLPALLEALNKKLLENYNFTIYAANSKERSVNFGILNTFRQYWTPLTYQAGPLVKTIPLAPKQTQKLVITRKTVKKRTQKELENNLRVLKQESSETNRAEQQIASKASSSTSLSVTNEAKMNYEVDSDTLTTGFKQDTAKSSEDTKKSFHEAVFKSAQEFKEEKTTEINTEETHESESVETTEITNPNDEIAVTFLFYELQRRYRIYERLYRVQPVVLVAQEFPQPSDIDQAWLVRYDWILRRAILDDSFLATLNNLAQTAGDEIAIEEMKTNVNQQRCIVQQLKQELAIASSQAAAQRAAMDQAVYHKAGGGGLFGIVEGIAGSALSPLDNLLFGGDSGQNDSNRQALQDRADEAADQVRDLTFRVEREVTALNALTESYTKALRDHNNHLTEIARLQVHVKDNIMYYMQAIWAHEPPDQRFFRLHNTPVPDMTHQNRGFRIGLDEALATTMARPHESLPRFGGRDLKAFPCESVTTINSQFTFQPLSEVADVSTLLGFKGNYAIFPLYQSNPLTDFMMDPYVDRATGQLVDPSDPLNWSLDEFSQYVCCLKEKLTDDELQKLLPQLQTLYQAILTNPQRDDDVLIVPTNSLFIEALPGEHTLLERFKLDHRMIDVKKAQAETREKELDNIRMTARILSGERGDPHIDKKILIEGGGNFVIPAGDQ